MRIGGRRGWLARLVVILVAALVLAMAAVLFIPLGRQPAGRLPEPGPTLSPAPVIPTLEPTPEPVTVEPALIDLADLGWWDLRAAATQVGPGATSGQLDRLRVGTLDGRLVADLALSEGAFAAGPYGPLVLAGHDDGTISEVFIVSTDEGRRQQILLSDAIVPVASLAADGSVYFVRVDRASGMDEGLWRLPAEGGAQELAVPGPLVGERPSDRGDEAWRMRWGPGGTMMAVQWCGGAERCMTYLVDTAEPVGRTRRVDMAHPVGPILGFSETELAARGVNEADGDIVAVEIGSLGWRTVMTDASDAVLLRVAGAWVLATEQADGRIRIQPLTGPSRPWDVPAVASAGTGPIQPQGTVFGAATPNGWLLRWPAEAVADAGALVNVVSGEPIAVPPLEPVVQRSECPFIAPAELPSGAEPGPMVQMVEGGLRYARWSRGADRVIQATGAWVVGSPDEVPPASLIEVRGQPARVVLIGDESTGEIALVWEEQGCEYTVWLSPGSFVADVEDFARRY